MKFLTIFLSLGIFANAEDFLSFNGIDLEGVGESGQDWSSENSGFSSQVHGFGDVLYVDSLSDIPDLKSSQDCENQLESQKDLYQSISFLPIPKDDHELSELSDSEDQFTLNILTLNTN